MLKCLVKFSSPELQTIFQPQKKYKISEKLFRRRMSGLNIPKIKSGFHCIPYPLGVVQLQTFYRAMKSRTFMKYFFKFYNFKSDERMEHLIKIDVWIVHTNKN